VLRDVRDALSMVLSSPCLCLTILVYALTNMTLDARSDSASPRTSHHTANVRRA
jgi:hypothetical protein